MPCYVDRHVADGQYPGILGIGIASPQVRSDARDQHPDGERLEHVVVGAGLEATDDVTRIASRSHHQYWHASRLRPNPTADYDSVQSWQPQVEQDHVRLVLPKGRHRRFAVGGENGLKPLCSQYDAQHFCQFRIVIDNQHLTLHRLRHSSKTRSESNSSSPSGAVILPMTTEWTMGPGKARRIRTGFTWPRVRLTGDGSPRPGCAGYRADPWSPTSSG